MASLSREELVDRAKLAEEAERFEEVVECMACIAKMDKDLTLEERNLLSVGFKNLLGAKCASERVLTSMKSKEEEIKAKDMSMKQHCQEIKAVEVICQNLNEIVDTHLLPTVSNAENSVLYNTIKGDCYKYMSKFKDGPAKRKILDQALNAYKIAAKTAEKSLLPTNKIRLELAVSMSALYEVMESMDRASQVAKEAFDEALSTIAALDEEGYKDNMELLKILRDNLTVWKSKMAVGTGHSLDGAGKISVSHMPRAYRKMTSGAKSDFKGKVIYMSSPMPALATAEKESPEEQDQTLEPTYSYEAEKNKIQEQVRKVESKLEQANDNHVKKKLQAQLDYLAVVADIVR